jgi:hypothetical protein
MKKLVCLCICAIVFVGNGASAEPPKKLNSPNSLPQGKTMGVNYGHTLPAAGAGQKGAPKSDKSDSGYRSVESTPPAEWDSAVETASGRLQNKEPLSDSVFGQIPPGPDGDTVLGQFAGQHNATMQQKTLDSMSGMMQNTQMTEAANVGNQQQASAQQTRESGGRDALNQQSEAARSISQAETKRSWSNVLNDGITEGTIQGGSAFGGAIGKAGADKTINAVFGGPSNPPQTDGTTTGTGKSSGATGGGQSGGQTAGQEDGQF